MSKLRIKELIREKGMTIEAVANVIGVNASAISQSINGNPTLERLQQIADVLNVPVVDMFEKQPKDHSFICPNCGTTLNVCRQNKEY